MDEQVDLRVPPADLGAVTAQRGAIDATLEEIDATLERFELLDDEPWEEIDLRHRSAGTAHPFEPTWDDDPQPSTWVDRQHPDIPPLTLPAGYWVDGRGALRRECDRQVVPGSVPVTLDRAHSFPSSAGWVLVPVLAVRTHDELAWCADFDMTMGAAHGVPSVPVHEVPVGEWRDRAATVFAYSAPELMPDRMWDIDTVAASVGVSRQTITTYLARSQMPAPQTRVANSPLWAAPVIAHWEATRSLRRRHPDLAQRPANALHRT